MFFLHFSGSYIADSAPYKAVGPFKEAWEAEEWYAENCAEDDKDEWGTVTLMPMIHPDDLVE
jgi:hypothetical protein